MLQHRRRPVAGMSLIGLLLLAPAVARADPITLIGFIQLGKHLSDLSSLTAKLPSFPQFLGQSHTPDRVVDTRVAQTWWQGDPEVLDAMFMGRRLDSAREEQATHDYLAARIYDLAGGKVTTYYAYLYIQQEEEGCSYWETAALRRRELESEVELEELLNQINIYDGEPQSWWFTTYGYAYLGKSSSEEDSSPSPEAKALEETYERACSPQRLWLQPVGSQHPISTPAEAAKKDIDSKPASNSSLFLPSGFYR
jgi:hypothetical protein